MMANKNKVESMVLHATLITLAVAFVYPFAWMFFNSMKISDEIAQDAFTLLPRLPKVSAHTPFIDNRSYQELPKAEFIDGRLWQRTSELTGQWLSRRLASWQPRLTGEVSSVPVYEQDRGEYVDCMIKALLTRLVKVIPDKYMDRRFSGLADEELNQVAQELSDYLNKQVTEDYLVAAFTAIYRNLALTAPRLMIDMVASEASSDRGWQVVKGDARLMEQRRIKNSYELLEIDYGKGKEIVLEYRAKVPKGKSPSRVYIGFKSDNSWARVYFEVERGGKIYAAPYENMTRSAWFRQQLRWEEEQLDPMEPQHFALLKDTGRIVADTGDCVLRMRIVRGGLGLAVLDKMLNNYFKIFRVVPFLRYILTSLSICILAVIFSLFSCTLTAYAFARLKWVGRNAFFALMMATMMIPPQVTMIPGFLINCSLGFYNTLFPLWIFMALGNAFYIFLLRQFMMTLPTELEDAAKIDGCGFLRIYWHVILPLVKPTMCTIAIFTFIATWNNFMGALIYVSDERLFPLAFGLFKFNLSKPDTGLMMAGAFIMTMPIIVVFFFAQKFFIQGVALSGTKG